MEEEQLYFAVHKQQRPSCLAQVLHNEDNIGYRKRDTKVNKEATIRGWKRVRNGFNQRAQHVYNEHSHLIHKRINEKKKTACKAKYQQ